MNKLIAKTVVMLLLLAIGACTSSEEDTTGSIYGKVTDNKNGEVLQGVTITLTPGGVTAHTNSLDSKHSSIRCRHRKRDTQRIPNR